MPPRGRPSSSHSSRPSRSSRPSSSHSSRSHSSHSSHSSRRSYTPHTPHPPRPPRFGPSHRFSGNFNSGRYGGPPPPPDGYRGSGYRRGCSPLSGCIGIIMVIIISVGIMVGVQKLTTHDKDPQRDIAVSAGAESHQPMYVAALGRDVPWSDEYDSYYDAQTDCYFFLNTELEPPIWQYWFEGLSSQYGDYGWLEWDAKESRWYVQRSADKWELLPEQDASDLWHFDS